MVASRRPDTQTYMDDGCQVCGDAILFLDIKNKTLAVHERKEPATHLLLLDLRVVEDIECRMILSGNQTYEAGRVRLAGTFDERRGEERFTIKLPYKDYKRLADGIETMLGIRP
jgi:hypothetical protein